jgi:UDP-glucose 4-epimerase
MENCKVLITGGLGFIGSNLAIQCLKLGADVTILTKSLQNIKNIDGYKDKLEIIIGDITDHNVIENVIKNKEIIFHLAAQTSHITSMEKPILDIDINLIGTINILESCKNNNKNAKIIMTGTVTQLGKAKKLPINENMKDIPLSIYETNKLICEKYLQIYHQAYGMHTTMIRLATIFGERQQLNNPRFGITNYFIGRILNGEDIKVYGDGKFIRDYNYVGNVIDALILSAQNENSKGEVFLLGSNRGIYFIDMVKEVIKAVEEITGKKGKFTLVDFPQEQSKIDVGDTLVDYSKIKEKIGWQPKVNFEEGIRKTISFYKNEFEEFI